MSVIFRSSKVLLLLATVTVSGSLYAQDAPPAGQPVPGQPSDITVTGTVPAELSGMPAGRGGEGFIPARRRGRWRATPTGGPKPVVFISDATQIGSGGGFRGASRTKL